MSNRKTRKQKQQSEQRRRKSQIKELQDLREKAIQLEKQIAEQKIENFKQLNIRNLRVFGNTCNFIAPFVISAGLTVGAFRLFGGGLPFHSDEIVKYKAYNLDYKTNGYVTMDESYRTNRWFDDSLPSNELTIYTPWEFKDNQYMRYKREYDISKLNTLDLFDAVLEEDYAYITNNIKEYKEEIQVANSIEETEGQDYFFEASLHMLDKEDVLKYNETNLKNTIITIIELVLGLGIGGAIAYFRDFEYLWELKDANIDYHYRIKAIKPMQEELVATNEKILSLSRKKGGTTDDK
ncbi:MAG TPA: hypothetical protein DHV70_06785 [Firmicutes bacterium]|nr:hypothetical protein [Bacillota bacterium]